AEALRVEPSLNGTIRFGRFVPHDSVDVTFLVSMPDGSDLGKAKITNVPDRSITEIARDLRERAARLRNSEDDDWERSKGLIKVLPPFLLRPVVHAIGWLTGALGLEAKSVGLERYPFGSAIVTSVGMLGLDDAFVPPTPFARVPLYVLIGAVSDRPTVENGEVVIRPMLTITATLDHRFVDGFQAAAIARVFRRIFEDPWQLDGLEKAPPSAPSEDREVEEETA
ncbi:MAG: 2-oxo acid dehydrogenase subunit E2, partial [Nitriliruptorales bacterium]|nr:2-oxo acid dehydrogenase subunit E2 [Nitriliruptorales bacterium]